MFREIQDAHKRSFQLFWEHLVTLIALNVLWMIAALPVVTFGPGTLAAYWWVAHVARDGNDREGLVQVIRAIRRFFWRGLIWSSAWALLLWLAVAGTTIWPRVLADAGMPPITGALVRVVWFYILIVTAAMQPYLLEALTVEELPWGVALKRSAWHLLANPMYSHAMLIVPATALAVGLKFSTLVPLVLISLILCFLAAGADSVPWKYGRPRPVRRREEDVL